MHLIFPRQTRSFQSWPVSAVYRVMNSSEAWAQRHCTGGLYSPGIIEEGEHFLTTVSSRLLLLILSLLLDLDLDLLFFFFFFFFFFLFFFFFFFFFFFYFFYIFFLLLFFSFSPFSGFLLLLLLLRSLTLFTLLQTCSRHEHTPSDPSTSATAERSAWLQRTPETSSTGFGRESNHIHTPLASSSASGR